MAKVKERPPEEVRADYRRHDEVESNPPSRELFESNQPSLDEAQRQIVDELNTQGYTVVPVAELFSPQVWEELATDAAEFTREMERQLAGGTEPKKKAKPGKPGKPEKPKKEKAFMGRRYKKAPLTLESPWLRLGASSRMLDIVNTYLGMWSKLSYADQWYSPPRGSEADRVGSMRWHRDYNDQHLVKAFVYLVDVDEGTGPLQYVPGSARGGPYANEWPWEPMGETYPPPDEFERRIPDSAVKTFTAPEGSMILANTSGFHRGGFATENPRNIWVYNYVSPAALAVMVERNFDVGNGALGDLAEVERFALT
jgi:hypothetical protein